LGKYQVKNIFRKSILFITVLSLSACGEDTDYEFIGRQGSMLAYSVPSDLAGDVDHYRRVVAEVCPSSEICIISFFVGLSSVRYPLSDNELAAQTAQYNRNSNSGLDRLMLACRLSTGGPSNCFSN
jgi:hypothetical protein